MIRRFYDQLPEFARPGFPLMRYMLLRDNRRVTPRTVILRGVFAILLLIALVLMGYQVATAGGQAALDGTTTFDNIFLILFWPLVVIQIIARIFALTSSSGVIAAEVQHGTWDTLKVTTDGAVLTMKTRWFSIFYRLRWLLLLLVAARIVFIIGALITLSTFQGRYLDLLLSGTTPFGPPNVSDQLSTFLGIVTMALMMTTALLAPFTALAFDAAVGMLLGTIARGRVVSVIGQMLLAVARIIITMAALVIGATALSLASARFFLLPPITNPVLGWLGAFFGIGEGDLGLTLLYLPHLPRLWADLDYGVLVGVALLGYVLLQAALANAIVLWAARRASRADIS